MEWAKMQEKNEQMSTITVNIQYKITKANVTNIALFTFLY